AFADLNEPDAILRATAIDPKDLTQQQAAVAIWLSRRYRVAPEPISRLVKEAWSVGNKVGLEPTLILSIMAIESSFNPFAQSSVGAQGLMQVMTQVHDDKYLAFGGNHAAFDPVTNLRVGAQVLKECIARAGSLEAGLRFYVGAANLTDDGGYAGKVLAEQEHLRLVASGKTVAVNAPLIVPPPVTLPAALTGNGTHTEPVAPTKDKTAEQVALLH
ncbi:MAG TPA: lytic transglycosylase domain-containing protein, partial [Rhizobacter sp.]|nr:lytic transglycosylase domain-containing protein [Rhizobacter sp.]